MMTLSGAQDSAGCQLPTAQADAVHGGWRELWQTALLEMLAQLHGHGEVLLLWPARY